MDYVIENNLLKVTVSDEGAELQHMIYKPSAQEYIWCADPAYWGKKSPVLFPVVGTLKNDTYYYEGKAYSLPRHGFARTKKFSLIAQEAESLLFSLKDDKSTNEVYPFAFELQIKYTIEQETLSVSYIVKNPDSGDLYFSVGGHPAFAVPMFAGEAYEDYVLAFEQKETSGRWPISADGLIEQAPDDLLQDESVLPLSKSLFHKDAVVLKYLKSSYVDLVSKKRQHGLRFNFPGFPYLGLWAAKDADFVCIEPWCGIADSVQANQQLPDKEGMLRLEGGGVFERTWSVSVI
ncbi:MAG: aldose 1-epimerase family protein [Niabella sp.]